MALGNRDIVYRKILKKPLKKRKEKRKASL
jgi:hypothetical protein